MPAEGPHCTENLGTEYPGAATTHCVEISPNLGEFPGARRLLQTWAAVPQAWPQASLLSPTQPGLLLPLEEKEMNRACQSVGRGRRGNWDAGGGKRTGVGVARWHD